MSDMVDALTERMAGVQQRTRERGRTGRHERMRAEVLRRMDEPDAGPAWSGWVWPVAVVAMAMVIALGWSMRPRALTFEVQGGSAISGSQAFFGATDDEPLTLAFSDGSAVELRPRARVRVAALRDDGADLVLESGAVDVRLHDSASTWSVEAGPYRVSTPGADFVARWSPEERAFELQVREGEARVQGPGIEGGREAAAGESMVLGGTEAEPVREPPRAAEAAEAPEPPDDDGPDPAIAEEPEAAERPVTRRAGSPRRPSARPAPSEPAADWRALARRGEHREALAAAEAAGFGRLCDSLGAAALLELADVARYARASARAREALSVLRRRFPGTEAAATAAFDLGRLGGRCSSGARWFRTYLDERPGGSMAEAARQRLAECPAESAKEAGSTP